MKPILTLFLLAVSAQATWSVDAGYPATSGVPGTGCNSASGTSCAISSLTSSTAHDMYFMIVSTSTNVVTAVTDTNGDTFTKCTACQGAVSGAIISIWYCLDITASNTSITATVTNNEGRGAAVYELHSSVGSLALDTGGAATATCTNCTGVALTLTYAADALFQVLVTTGGVTISGITTYSNRFSYGNASNTKQSAQLLNTSSGAAPTWTNASITNGAIAAIAFAEGVSGATTAIIPAIY